MSQDNKQAAAWYQPSAEQGLGPAQINLGVLCANGRGEGIPLAIDSLRDIDGGLVPGFVF